MKKYWLRILTVLLIVCFGACLFAACGGDGEQGDNPDDQPATYSLTYQANGGTGADITEKLKEGEKVTLKGADAFTYEGHTFTGWNDGTTTYEGGGEFTMPANNVTMKAQWQENGSDVPAYSIKVTDPSGKAHVEFDKQGPYHKGDVVKFTVDFAPGDNLRVTSVKADGAELQKGTDGMYSVTFAEKDIEITITSESTGAHEFNVSLSVTGDANGNSAALDKQGAVGKDEKVTLTVVTAEGYSVEVKLNGSKIDLNAEGKYELTVTADAAFTVTFTKNGENPPAKTYNITCTSEHVTVKFDQNGPYNSGTVVTFTVTAESGYEIVSVKNGNTVLSEQNGKYSVTVGEADIVITVETREVTAPQPQGKTLKEFADSNALPLNDTTFQLILRAKADGYATVDELKGDVKLLIGSVEIEAHEVTVDGGSGIYNMFFWVEVSKLAGMGDSAEVKLKSTAANKTYECPATAVNETEYQVQFEHDVYTLKLEGNKLVLAHTRVEVVEKKITFAGTTFAADGEGKIYIMINFQTVQGYEAAELAAAKLKVGSLEFAAIVDPANTMLLRFDLTGGEPTVETLSAEQYAVVLVVGGDNYECPTVTTGQVGRQTKDNRTYTLKEEGGKLYLTVEGSSVTPPPSSGYIVTYTGEHVTVTFEKSGPYEANTVVYFTVTVESGYKLVSVKNGDTVLHEENGKYSVTVTDANIVLTIETASDGTTPQPSDKALKEFADSNVLPLNNTAFQLILRAKADGYATVDELKADVKLLIGIVEFEAHEVTKAESGIYNLFFHVEASKLANIGDGAEVKLKLTSANRTYDCPSSAVNEAEFQVQFEHDVYTLKLESGKLVLAHTRVEVVEKKITFAGTTFAADGEGKIYIMINFQTVQGYEAAELAAAKLKVGSLEFAAIVDPANTMLLRFDLTGGEPTVETLSAEQYAVVLVVGGDNYECPTVTKGQVGQQKKGNQTFTLKEEGGKLYLTVEGSAIQLDPIEGVWTGAEDLTMEGTALSMTAYVKKGDTYIDFLLEMDPVAGGMGMTMAIRLPQVAENDYKISDNRNGDIEVRLSEGKLIVNVNDTIVNGTFTTRSADMGSITLPASGTYSGTVNYRDREASVSLTFGAQPALTHDGQAAFDLELSVIGKYIVCFEKEDANNDTLTGRLLLTAGADENTFTGYYDGISFTLTKEGTTPTEKSLSDFGLSEIGEFGAEGFRILLRAKATGYTADTLKAALQIKINNVLYNAQEVGADSDGTYRIYFLIKNEEAAAIENGDYKVTLVVDGQAEEVKAITSEVHAPSSKVEIGGRAYSLKAENHELTLTVAGESTPPQPQAEFTATGATLEVSGEKVYFVLSGTVTGLADAEAVEAALNTIYFDLQELNTTEYRDDFARTVTVGEQQDGVYSWTIKFDISALETKTNAYIAHFRAATGGDNPGMDLKLTAEQAVPNTTVQNSAHKFTLLNENGQNDEAHNWGCVAVKVEDIPRPAVQTTVTFDVDGDRTKVPAQTYEEGNVFHAPDAPAKENYTFLYWYYMDGDTETQVGEGFIPSDHADDNHALTLYAKWQLNDEITLNDVNATTWDLRVYEYPEALKPGQMLTLTGNLTFTGKNAAGENEFSRWDGVQYALSTTAFADHATFAYDWRINREEGKYAGAIAGALTITNNPNDWVVGLDQMVASGTNHRLTAIVSYVTEGVVEVYYVYTTSLNGKDETFTISYIMDGLTGQDISVALSGEAATLTGGKIVRSAITAEVADTMAQENITVGTAESNVYNVGPHYEKTIKQGQTLTVKGTLQNAPVNNYQGFAAEIFPYGSKNVRENVRTNLRIDNFVTGSDGWVFEAENVTRYNLKIAKSFTRTYAGHDGYGDTDTVENGAANGESFWTDFANAKVNSNIEIIVEWKEADLIVVTYKITSNVEAYSGYSATQTYEIRPLKDGSHLNSLYTVWIQPDGAYLQNATAVVTSAASSPARQSAVLSSGESLVYEATADEIGMEDADGIVARLNIGGGNIQFCANGLHIFSDGGEETVIDFSASESKPFGGSEYRVDVSIDLPQMLNAKKKA